jgi:hypothetical protein
VAPQHTGGGAVSGWSTVTWTAARAGGITAYLLLALSVVLGLALAMRWQHPKWPRLITNELHRFLTLLSLSFIGVHVAAVWLDPFTRFGWQEVFVPLASHYRPLWVALGIVAGYLGVAVWISTQLRPWIGHRWWRRLHFATFAVYALSTVHGIAAGSDAHTPWAIGLYSGSLFLVGALLAARLLTPIGVHGQAHPKLVVLAGLALVSGMVWAASGPWQPGWSGAANTAQENGASTTAVSSPGLGVLPAQGTQMQRDPSVPRPDDRHGRDHDEDRG